jgi:hypothetical protein
MSPGRNNYSPLRGQALLRRKFEDPMDVSPWSFGQAKTRMKTMTKMATDSMIPRAIK